MPKMKTHRGAAKRFSRTGSGKIKFKHANMQHNFGHMSKVQKKRLIKTGYLKSVDAKVVDRVLNGG
ncbi:MAG: 50S ribosomal protein L35 [Deltaproteobacteria bacterium]|nr:MAG: 50S ribosomal protein L35 [Deltaproteobacteria bacterium]